MSINNIIKQFIETLPPGVQDFKQDCKQHMEANLKHLLNDIDVVTREEFEIQKKVLYKTRLLLNDLEKKIKILEEKNNQ